VPHTTSFRHEAYCSPSRLFFLPFSLARFGRATTHAALSPAETPANWPLSNLELALFGLTPRSPLRSSGQPAQADCIADRSCATKRGTHTTSECALSCRLSGCCVVISDPEMRVQLKVRWSVAPERREQGRADRSRQLARWFPALRGGTTSGERGRYGSRWSGFDADAMLRGKPTQSFASGSRGARGRGRSRSPLCALKSAALVFSRSHL
jgi:hypothetical protein